MRNLGLLYLYFFFHSYLGISFYHPKTFMTLNFNFKIIAIINLVNYYWFLKNYLTNCLFIMLILINSYYFKLSYFVMFFLKYFGFSTSLKILILLHYYNLNYFIYGHCVSIIKYFFQEIQIFYLIVFQEMLLTLFRGPNLMFLVFINPFLKIIFYFHCSSLSYCDYY